ncbi:MAG TPA: heat-inducible transcriptional repressor HrcA [Bacilli bacterium]|nr:heat-inducible transcriptional repressor HrcA [Bacilli bacterium]
MDLALKEKQCQEVDMLTTRQKELLSKIVYYYVKDAKPVGSKLICKELNCSSATIRNEMATLEELGYLEKNHISSGRIPSELGYRYYVDNLMKPKEISGEDLLKFQIILNNQSIALNDYIKRSLEIISEITNCASVVLGKNSSNNKLKQVEVVPVDDENLIAIVVTDKGHVESKNMMIKDVSLEEVKKTVDLINKLLIGTPIDEISSKLEFEVKPIIAKYVTQHEVLYNAFYDAFSDFSNKNVSFVGRSNMLKQPEFNSVEKVKSIIEKLDSEDIIDSIESDENEIKVYIGKENEIDDDVTVIKTSYNYNGEEGTIAIIGPKRMEYDRVVSLLDYIKKNIDKRK